MMPSNKDNKCARSRFRKRCNDDPTSTDEPPSSADPISTTLEDTIADFSGNDAKAADDTYQELLQIGADAIEPLLEIAQISPCDLD